MIEQLAVNPGHFASSMGAVEIAVALHYVFDTPRDRIVWDVGHQAYAHKILTGRREAFSTLRKRGGISGFPNPAESPYDAFIAGHASNSISAALGIALASAIKGEKRRNVIAVIGDASIAGGLAFEGLNNAALSRNNLLIILNDNDMAIDEPTGSLNRYMTRINTSPGYNALRYSVYNSLKRLHLINERQRGKVLRFNNSLKSLLGNHQNIFEGLNVRYFGPFDGNDVTKLCKILDDIKDMDGPRILHVRTRKGKGYAPAEADPTTWHAPGMFDPATGQILKRDYPTPQPPKYQDVAGQTLTELAAADDRIVGITAAMATGTSLTFMLERFPERAFDVGISEGHAVTFAAGLAREGMRPYCCIYSTFLQRAYDNIIHDVALQRLPVTFCIDRGGLVGADGATHQGVFDLAYLRLIPNMIIAAPSDEPMLRNLMYTSSSADYGPFAIRYPRGRGVTPDWRTELRALPIGKGVKVADGSGIAVLSIGTALHDAAAAIERARATDGISTALYDMIFLKPIDEELLREVAQSYHTIITVEDGTVNGGLGSAVAEWLTGHHSPARLISLGVPDRFIAHAKVNEQKAECGIDADTIYNTIIANSNKQ